jgi:hypothetical protein
MLRLMKGASMPANRQLSRHLSAVLLSLALAWAPAFAAGPAGHSHDHAGAPAMPSLDAGRKWSTDEPLRKAMGNIRQAMDRSLPAIHAGKLSAAEYGALAKTINGEVGYMVSNCKLEPKADAQLHLIIAELLDGAEAMEGKGKKVQRRQGAIKVLGALEHYGAYFDDPGRRAIEH